MDPARATRAARDVPEWAADLIGAARILIVDDGEANVRLLEAVLQTAGATHVEGLLDSSRAVERCLEGRPDILLLDLHMPGLDGFAVLEQLRARLPVDEFLPVVVLTADVNADARRRALAAGAKDFLTKPFDRMEVLLRVSNLLETRALHRRLEQRGAKLQDELDRAQHRARRLEAERDAANARIDGALAPGGLRIVYQPIVELDDGAVAGYEALSRFAAPPYRSPDQWFAEATRIGRGVELELFAVERALTQFEALPPSSVLALNIAPTTVRSELLDAVLAGVPGRRIVLELTEHKRVADYGALDRTLAHLREQGMRVAVDDAGAGYAGLNHMLRIRPDVVKLDLMLTRGIEVDPARKALATGLVRFAEEIDATVVAEGIETPGELAVLRDLGVRWGQGFFLGRPAALPSAAPVPVPMP